eukprot:scaffold669266_cov57-Prasinocladus_malaysianus.AAC.1
MQDKFVVKRHLRPHTRTTIGLQGLYQALLSPKEIDQVVTPGNNGVIRIPIQKGWKREYRIQTRPVGKLPMGNGTEAVEGLPVPFKSDRNVEVTLVAKQGTAEPT